MVRSCFISEQFFVWLSVFSKVRLAVQQQSGHALFSSICVWVPFVMIHSSLFLPMKRQYAGSILVPTQSRQRDTLSSRHFNWQLLESVGSLIWMMARLHHKANTIQSCNRCQRHRHNNRHHSGKLPHQEHFNTSPQTHPSTCTSAGSSQRPWPVSGERNKTEKW